jgi:hypothetical protein
MEPVISFRRGFVDLAYNEKVRFSLENTSNKAFLYERGLINLQEGRLRGLIRGDRQLGNGKNRNQDAECQWFTLVGHYGRKDRSSYWGLLEAELMKGDHLAAGFSWPDEDKRVIYTPDRFGTEEGKIIIRHSYAQVREAKQKLDEYLLMIKERRIGPFPSRENQDLVEMLSLRFGRCLEGAALGEFQRTYGYNPLNSEGKNGRERK